MLWKKESNKPNALYVDIFALSKLDLDEAFYEILTSKHTEPHPEKDDSIALQKRNDGNAAFRRKAYKDALELYGDSLRFAKPGSEHISLAYANRSACFLKLQKFEKCLNDIKLAKDAGYTEHLMPKLNQRKTECLEQLENGANFNTFDGAELSFEPNKKFPCMANILKVQQVNTNENGNCMVVAKQDIDVGQTVVVEDSMFPYLYKHFGLKCNICLKGNENLVACKTCAVALFCSDCQGNFLHEYECGLNVCGDCVVNREVLNDVRTILLIIKAFPTVDELMAFIEQIQKNKKMPTDLTDFQSKYQVYFNNTERRCGRWLTDAKLLALECYPTYRTILKIPRIKAMFQSRKHLRFLVHLIGHSTSIIKTYANSKSIEQIALVNENQIHIGSIELVNSDHRLFTEFYPTLKYTQHSCYPNVENILTNGKLCMVTTRPIKKGEQVLKSSIPIEIESTLERQHHVPNCECPRCKDVCASADQRAKLSSEPAFVEIVQSHDKSEKTIKKCEVLLQKYGHIDWCDEINMVMMKYRNCLFNRMEKS